MLQNLYTLREQLRNNYLLTFWEEDRELPLTFRNQVATVETYDISFNYNSFVAKSNNGLKIYFPNQLWSIASFFSEYYHAINEYVVYIKDVLGIDKEVIKECCNNEIKTEIIINKYPEISPEDKVYLIKFLSDYKWWGGGKTIDRLDYYYSPIISLSGLVNASQGFVAELCKYLASNPSLQSILKNQNIKIAQQHPRRLVASTILADFCVQVIRYLYKNSLIENLSDFSIYSNGQIIGDESKKIKIATENSSLTGIFLKLGNIPLKDRPDNKRWDEDPILFKGEKVYISNQWYSTDDYQLTLSDLQNMLDDIFPNKFTIKNHNGCYFLYEGKVFAESNETESLKYDNTVNPNSLQQIIYGAPGTGKSFSVEESIKKYCMKEIRTTFHPDSDYSTFVGTYKPQMELVDVYGAQGVATGRKEKKIVYKYSRQAFLQAYISAWEDMENPYVLVIEEINRGNCAQIFGDLFQLLDRNDKGFSSYYITPDIDITQELSDAFYQLSIPNANAINDLYMEDVVSGINNGTKLILPNNLYIWATMNTSDQSLFPIDSAFKRRWDWKYVPISNANLGWVVCINGIRYDWWSFVEEINKEIGDTTHSEDKKLGYFFCKAKKDDNTIPAEKFVGKVLFYIYNDVFRDYGFDRSIFKDENDKDNPILMFKDFFMADGKPREDKIKVFMDNLHVKTEAEVTSMVIVDNDESNVESEVHEEIETSNENVVNELTNIDGNDYTKYSFNGLVNLGKGELAIRIIEKYLSEHEELTYQQIKETFPDSMMGNKLKLYGLIVTEKDIADASYSYKKKAYGCFKADRHYKSSDGVEFYISNYWNITNIQSIIDFAEQQGWNVKANK